MTKAQIEDVMNTTLQPNERKRVELIEIIGSASMKTVVRVRVDGREAVMMVGRPHADATIPTNLDLGAAFLEKVKAKKIDIPLAMLEMLIDPLKEQMADETKMTAEADRIEKAASLLPGMNERLPDDADGWRFEVPRVIDGIPPRDSLMFVELAEDVAFDELAKTMPAKEHAQLGRFVVKSQLKMLFVDGVFDPDRHFGNWKFDAKRKVISAFDFGQLEEYKPKWRFSSDDRMSIARFLQGVSEGKPSVIADAVLAMATPATAAKMDRATLEEQIKATLAATKGMALDDQMTKLISTVSDAGVRLQKKFVFGALKGLLVLAREGYVTRDDFEDMLRDEVTTLLHNKAPALIADAMKRGISGAAALLRR